MSLLEVDGLSRDYRGRGPGSPVTHALRGVSFELGAGETLAVIGESGSGKTTLMRLLLALDGATAGTVRFAGREVVPGPARTLGWLRRETGIVLQDPYSSLDPRMSVGASVSEPLRALGVSVDHRARVRDVLARVGLDAELAGRYPHELSGGQRQRVALSRAIVHGPKLLIGDEPLSALDVTVRAQVLELLRELHRDLGLAVVLVSHDIGLVQHFAERVLVMHDGEVVEAGASAQVLAAPQHPYTRRLLAAVPRLSS
ncbi:ABC transporter ATP-binding protein [Gryllotalpicola reticulitermitis]|uniref:ABC transporter ATP-binding protein n=1 Tax=Gryllotalpicola reticulitermitis TaxID=1184153 RepID=A0ABV8QAB0_9MICO